jgi:hypothetical protein
MLNTHLHLHAAHIRRTSGLSLGTFKQSNALSEIGELWIEEKVRVLFFLSPQKIKWMLSIARVTKQSYVTEDNKGLACNK